MEQVTGQNAFQIGWYVQQLMEKGLDIKPIMIDGIYTDAVYWRAQDPTGRFVSVQLTITPTEQ